MNYYITMMPGLSEGLLKFDFKTAEEITEEMVEKILVAEKYKSDILCRICKNRVSSPDNMISIDGRHSHRFTNPLGIEYEIGLFSDASGCMVMGSPTREHTWFPGFSWNFALCSQCFSHLGWYYRSADKSFFGLILKNLIENSTVH